MSRIVLDTNILLDYYGCADNESCIAEAKDIIEATWRRGESFYVTSTQIKDFQYVCASRLKRALREQKGAVSARDLLAVSTFVEGCLNNLLELGTVAAEGPGECEMARVLMKTHPDFEDNLIAAMALRIDADFIVTRDKAFSVHCPVTCLSPKDALIMLNEGVFL